MAMSPFNVANGHGVAPTHGLVDEWYRAPAKEFLDYADAHGSRLWPRESLDPMQLAPEEQVLIDGDPVWDGDVAPPRATLRRVPDEWDDYFAPVTITIDEQAYEPAFAIAEAFLSLDPRPQGTTRRTVVALQRCGLDDSQIAAMLEITQATVRKYTQPRCASVS